jgi:hypothetical protein
MFIQQMVSILGCLQERDRSSNIVKNRNAITHATENLAPAVPSTNLALAAAPLTIIWLRLRLCGQIWLLRQLRRQIFGSAGTYLAPLTIIWLRLRLRWQIWLLRQLRRQIFRWVGKFGCCGSSFGKYLAGSANLAFAAALLANIWLGRHIWLHLAPSANLAFAAAPSANIWLSRHLFGSVGKFGFCGYSVGSCGSVGKYLAPAAPLAN